MFKFVSAFRKNFKNVQSLIFAESTFPWTMDQFYFYDKTE